ncbi:MAG: TrkA family potassium uptake protein [Dehalococcoidales bacterium]|nr:TrkA family potassium uptake protein [Dehalococcoidales bacterium]MDD3264842.1 TrkA family potassium uptake protein [Dehalococcoidales bacterium]MDD4322657.1 TrkA family potassium uptake protein [Dehalococcoidales bacterium]MDD4794213.1 TrkA family potassium uptake protein [Dehalococcoidales bacterium]MDD5498472.1 TrkA family potassium uptake protein [Dehalococcoidales bacterium]
MYVIIVGGGRLGFRLAQWLLSESHEVLVIDKRQELVDRIVAEMGSVAIVGDGCEGKTLESAGARRADIFISLTSEDEDNLVACQIARHYFKIPRTIARVMDERSEPLFQILGIDIINSTNIILEYIKHELPSPPVMHLLKEQDMGMEVVDVTIPSSSAVIGKAVSEISLPEGAMVALIIRRDSTPVLPQDGVLIEEGDQVIAAISPENEPLLRSALTGK